MMAWIEKNKKFLYIAAVFMLSLLYATRQFKDFDYWFHYAAGEWITINKKVPQIPIYSWYGLNNNLIWISHEWLFGLLIYLFSNLFGEGALVIVCPILFALAVVMVINYKSEKWFQYPILLLIVAICVAEIGSSSCTPRPQILMYIMFVFLVKLLFDEYENPSKKIWWIAPLTVLWTNLHGGSYILIFIFFALLIVLQLKDYTLLKLETKAVDKNVTKQRLIVFLISFCLIVLNGHGLRMYLYPISNMADKVMINSITEWQPLNLNSLDSLSIPTVIIIAIFALTAVATKKQINFFKFVIAGMWIFLAFKSVRFVAQMAFALLLIIPDYLEERANKKDRKEYIVAAVLIIYCLYSLPSKVIDAYNNPFDLSEFPSDEMVEKLKELPEGTKLYNEYDDGSYLVYKHVNVFIDNRADIYSHYNLDEYMKANNMTTDIEKFIDKYDFDYMLVSNVSRIDYWLSWETTVPYEVIFVDGKFTLYKIIKEES